MFAGSPCSAYGLLPTLGHRDMRCLAFEVDAGDDQVWRGIQSSQGKRGGHWGRPFLGIPPKLGRRPDWINLNTSGGRIKELSNVIKDGKSRNRAVISKSGMGIWWW